MIYPNQTLQGQSLPVYFHSAVVMAEPCFVYTYHQRVGIPGHLLGPRFDDFAHNCVRTERLDLAKSTNLGPERCPMVASHDNHDKRV